MKWKMGERGEGGRGMVARGRIPRKEEGQVLEVTVMVEEEDDEHRGNDEGKE